jgi:hypothetical protein
MVSKEVTWDSKLLVYIRGYYQDYILIVDRRSACPIDTESYAGGNVRSW